MATGADYSLATTSLTFPAGDRSVTTTLTAADDNLAEGDETILIAGSHGGKFIGTPTVTIEANDTPKWAAWAHPPGIAEGASSTITVAITNGMTFDADQTIELAVTGTATSTDYSPLATTLTLPAGQTSAATTLTAAGDSLVEGEETVVMVAVHDGRFIGTADVAIRDGGRGTRGAGAGGGTKWRVRFSQDGIGEGNSASLTVDFTGGSSFAEPQNIDLAFTGTATGSDYSISKATLTLKPGESSAAANVYATNDELVEEDETVVITATRGDEVIGLDFLTIRSSDAPEWAVSALPLEIAEGESATIAAAITNGKTFDADQTVTLAVTGTASDSDYTLSATEFTLTAGASSVTANLTANGDTAHEEDETVIVAASHDGQTVGSATVTITDDDIALSTDATLSSLALSGIDIGTFSSGASTYSGRVEHDMSSTTVTTEPSDAGAAVTITDAAGSTQGTSRTVSLSSGDNEITVTVTAEDVITTKVYTVTVTRAESPALVANFISGSHPCDGGRSGVLHCHP